MTYIVLPSNSTTQQSLATLDTLYIGAGIRLAVEAGAIVNAASTSIQMSVIVDGMVSSENANIGAINLAGFDVSGFSNARVMIGQSGSVTSTLGNGIQMAGGSCTVDNAGNITARQIGVFVNGALADVSNAGTLFGQTNAVTVTGANGIISNSGNMRANTLVVSCTGDAGQFYNSGIISGLGDGVTLTGGVGFAANSGTIQTQGTGLAVIGSSGRISNLGEVQSQFRGLSLDGNSGQIANDGRVFGRTNGMILEGSNGNMRNTGDVRGFDGMTLFGDVGRITNAGAVTVVSSAIVTVGADNTVLNTSDGVLVSESASQSVINMGVSGTTVLRNDGRIETLGTGINMQDTTNIALSTIQVVNTGIINSGARALEIGVDVANILNTGTMIGGFEGITNQTGSSIMTVVNEGVIRLNSVEPGVVVRGNSGVDTIRNTGQLLGDVQVLGGADTVVNNGLIGGNLDLGADGDVFTSGTGRVTGAVLGGAGNDTLTGGANADRLDGGSEGDRLTGGSGNDSLLGRAGNDTLLGGAGNDRLTGATGTDVLTGSTGADVFEFTSAATVGIGLARDQVTDFAAGTDDFLMLFMASFIGNAAFTAAGQVRYVQATGILTGSTDGDAAAEWALLLVNRPVITAADFVF